MRIIAGEFRSRQLLSPPEGATTRPIPDRVKESLFSLLRGNVEGAAVLDCFAGTGAIGLEAVSRGAARCVLVERDKRVAEVLRRNIETLGCDDRAEVVQGDALGIGVLARCPRPVDLIFFDPPYDLILQPGGWERAKGQFTRLIEFLSDTGFAMLRTPWPFVHPDDETAEPTAQSNHRRRERRPDDRGRGHWSHDARPDRLRPEDRLDEDGDEVVEELHLEDGEWIGEDEQTDSKQVEPEVKDAEAPSAQHPKPQRHAVDLKIPGAVGPETHNYRHTALHLYMRKKVD